MQNSPQCIIVGFGPGVGMGVAYAFASKGYRLGLVSRNPKKNVEEIEKLSSLGNEVQCHEADAANSAQLSSAITSLMEEEGGQVLVYNAVAPTFCQPSRLNPEQLLSDLQVDVVGALVASQAVLPVMEKRAEGTILFTGGGWAHYPAADATSISVGKASIRALAIAMAQEQKEKGIKVGMVTVMGGVRHGSGFDPYRIGEVFYQMHETPMESHKTEVLFKEYKKL